MLGRLLIVLAVAANVAVAAVSVTGSAWLWERAGEPVVQREPVPALPSIVDETSVPFDQESARLWPAKKPGSSPSHGAAKAPIGLGNEVGEERHLRIRTPKATT